MTPVKSSAITHIGYDASNHVLTVKYHSGETYAFHAVKPEKYAALMAADSIGKHMAKHITPHHKVVRVIDDTAKRP